VLSSGHQSPAPPPPQLSIQVNSTTATKDSWWSRKSPQARNSQLVNNAVAAKETTAEIASKEEEEEKHPHFSNHLVEEHLQLLFKIRQKHDDQMHSESILCQRMDILFYALIDTLVCTRCPTYGQQFTPTCTIHR
jgi:hypothetical protein